jgi:hypothetical protein
LHEEAVTNLRRWLSEQGGSLVCYRGPPTSQVNERLDRLMPVRWTGSAESRFRMQLTDEGRELQWLSTPQLRAGENILTALPPLSTAAQVDGVKPLAVVLATATAAAGRDEQPVVSYQPYGSGRVVVIEGAGMWRWAFLPPEYQQQQAVYAAFWQSMLRWLVSDASLPAGQHIVLRTDKVNFTTTESASASLFMRGTTTAKTPQIKLTGNKNPLGEFTAVPIGESSGIYRIVFGKLPEGRYEAVVAGADPNDTTQRTMFDVQSLSDEKGDLQARPELMARIASESHGEVLRQADAEEIERRFIEYRQRTFPDRVRRVPAWDRWWVLVGVVGVWASAWTIRRSGGLV